MRFVVAGSIGVLLGTMLLLRRVREFYVAGRGTLAPWSPPVHLVSSGPYRFSRNPRYIGVRLILVGWATLFWSRSLVYYALAVPRAFHLRVLLAEQPRALRDFGAAWSAYRARVPRWLI